MQYISKLFVIVALLFVAESAMSQPPARKREKAKKEKKAASGFANVQLTERAKSQFPTAMTPQEVDWRRDVYRSLDLEKESNASLYYPIEPLAGRMNLFTFLFHNIINGNITAYSYNLDGYEQFTEENIVKPMDILENYRIYFEEKDGEIVVGKSDVPSAEVLSYYIKESHHYDQRTGTYGKRVTAICPVLHRSGEFSSEVTKYPMFWLDYNEIEQLLKQHTVMTSSLNNVTSMTFDDYFKKGCYNGEIYKTTNTRNLALAQYCKDSTEVKKEQKKIERQLNDFHTNLWNTKTIAEIQQDSIEAAAKAAKDSVDGVVEPTKEKKSGSLWKRVVGKFRKDDGASKNEKGSKEKKVSKKEKKSKSSGSSSKAARVSVRRTRR
ncbi:MAG: gliding motility protein GldN [Bacteroidaceae bacterium]|nr:gliding motility protein GldN [Bacteroidaceae bacterium]